MHLVPLSLSHSVQSGTIGLADLLRRLLRTVGGGNWQKSPTTDPGRDRRQTGIVCKGSSVPLSPAFTAAENLDCFGVLAVSKVGWYLVRGLHVSLFMLPR